MKKQKNYFGVSFFLAALLLLSACGGEDNSAPLIDAADSPEEAETTVTQELTAEEAAHLEAYRASRQTPSASNAPSAPVDQSASAKVDPGRAVDWNVGGLTPSKPDAAAASASPSKPAPNVNTNVAPSAPVGGRTAVEFQKHTLKEQTTGMPAFTVLVPEGWKIDSNIQRTPPQLASMFYLADILITAPDGREIHFYPGMTFHYSQQVNAQPFQPVYEKYFLPPPNSIGQLLMQFAQMQPDPTVKNLRIVSEEQLPAMTRQVRQLAAGLYQDTEMLRQKAMPGDEIFFDTQGIKTVVGYEQNGQAKEETFVAQYQIQSFSTAATGPIVQWGVYNMRSLSGPAGSDYTHDPVLITIAQSMQMIPQWSKAQHDYHVARIPRTAKPKPQKTPAETDAETRQTSLDGWKKDQASDDKQTEKFIDTIFEETAYTDTDGSTVKLSSHWDHAVSDGQGNIVMHNDPNWNLNADSNWNQRDWQTLTPK